MPFFGAIYILIAIFLFGAQIGMWSQRSECEYPEVGEKVFLLTMIAVWPVALVVLIALMAITKIKEAIK